MSKYIEIFNDAGEMKIDDSYECQRLISSGTITANITKGEVYGITFETGNGEFLSFRGSVGTTVYISPTVVWNNKLIKYVTSNSDDPITWYKWGKANKDFVATSSGVGLEIFNADSKLIYSSSQITGSFTEVYSIAPNEGFVYRTTMAHTYNIQSYQTTSGSVAALCSPWYTCQSLYADRHASSCPIYFCGYKFTEASIQTEGKTNTYYLGTLKGDGDLGQLRTRVYSDGQITMSYEWMAFAGVSCYNYMFFIIDTSIN